MPVWAIWLDRRVWFSSGMRFRKARDLAVEPRCTPTTDDPRDPVVVDGDCSGSPTRRTLSIR